MTEHRQKGQPPVDVCEFQVIGECKDDPGHLLLLDRDGRFYDYDIALGAFAPVEAGESWVVDVIDSAERRNALPSDKLTS